MASLNNSPPPLLQDVVNNMRDNILRTQSQASTVAITSYDGIVEQLVSFGAQINDKNVEITRLQELCKKNNIDYSIPPMVVPALYDLDTLGYIMVPLLITSCLNPKICPSSCIAILTTG